MLAVFLSWFRINQNTVIASMLIMLNSTCLIDLRTSTQLVLGQKALV